MLRGGNIIYRTIQTQLQTRKVIIPNKSKFIPTRLLTREKHSFSFSFFSTTTTTTTTNSKMAAPIQTDATATSEIAGAEKTLETVKTTGEVKAEGAAEGAEGGGEKELTKSGAKKEAKRLEKLAKLAAKSAKVAVVSALPGAAGAGGEKKEKKVKEKKVEEEEEVYVNTTPAGEKKDVSGPMSKSAYNPLAVESAWSEWWHSQNYFSPRYKSTPENPHGFEINGGKGQEIREEGCFVIPFPPPNVTGSLHCGHALAITLQDTMIRWNRMKGKTVLFNPGFDHAGISTQSVVENRIYKLEGKTRHDYGREAFLEKVWDWKEVYQKRITAQTNRLGASADWNRVAFTMDERLSKAVREAFCQFHEKGLLYRANRLVNWCVKMNTTLSNLEVDQKELTGRTMLNVPGYDIKEKFEFGAITSFAYQIDGTDEKIIVATTRPETMLGDTAVAVHPDDPRYTHLHGKFITHPFTGKKFPIITDDITVDMNFGTGAVKITPAHDPNDYECGKRHNLEFINIMNDDGTYNENAGPYKGMKRFHVRNQILKDMKENGMYVETKDNPMQIPVCSKSGDIIESIMKPQWWVNCQPLAAEALRRTKLGELKITPKSSEGDWTRWLENMQDWCISRQLWWGHRCPAYLITYDGEGAPDISLDDNWVVARSEEDAKVIADKRANGRKYTLEQDGDVLDTWFSSGLWPFSIMGWPDHTEDLDKFYPNSVLETGWDILFFWVARMVFFGNTLTGKMPFKELYCHGMVRDAEGRKMSKSLGNVIDPVDLIEGTSLQSLHDQLRQGNLPEKEILRAQEGQKKLFPKGIPQCGTDALRFALCNYSTGGRDVLLKVDDVAGYRRFCNKLWNATKFCMVKLGMIDFEGNRLQNDFVPPKTGAKTGAESLCEKWILHKLSKASANVNRCLEDRLFYEATETMHAFWLYELCDIFIEATKPLTGDDTLAAIKQSAQNTIYTCLETALRLIHPVMPFVSEDLWQRLPRRPETEFDTIVLQPFPTEIAEYNDPEAERDFDLVFSCIKAARSVMNLYALPTNGKTPETRHDIIIQAESPRVQEMIKTQIPIIESLVKGCRDVLIVATDAEVPAGCGSEILGVGISLHIPVKGKINAADEINKLEKKSTLAESNADKLKKLESQANYETIPADVRAKNTDKLKELEAEIEAIRISIEKFKSLA